jgi:ABC-2 type transport system permease protein
MKKIIKEIKFALYSIKKNIQSSSELRLSFLFAVVGMAVNNIAFLIIWMSFGQIAGGMGGWQTVDYLLAFGMSTLSYGICFGFFSGIRQLPEIVKQGDFDKFLLSPKNVLLRLSTSRFEAPAIGDLFFGIIAISVWVVLTKNISLFVFFNIIFFSILAVFIWFFYSVLINSLAFYFADSRTIVQGLFELLISPSVFYGGAFQGWLRNIFIFIVPSMLLGNLPLEIIKNPSLNMYLLTIGITLFWIMLSIYVFNKSTKKYETSNFINFG